MFTIRNNEINVDFEIVGGSAAPTRNVAAEIAALLQGTKFDGSATAQSVADDIKKINKNFGASGAPPTSSVGPSAVLTGQSALGQQVGQQVDEPEEGTDDDEQDVQVAGAIQTGGSLAWATVDNTILSELTKEVETLVNKGRSDEVLRQPIADYLEAQLSSAAIKLDDVAHLTLFRVIQRAVMDLSPDEDISSLLSGPKGKKGTTSKWSRDVNDELQFALPEPGKFQTLAEYFAAGNDARLPNSNVKTLACFNQNTTGNIQSNENSDCTKALVAVDFGSLGRPGTEKLSPEVVFGILKYLNFQMKSNNNVNKVQRWSEWAKENRGALAKLNQESKKVNGGAEWSGQGTVQALIDYMDANPAILNKNNFSEGKDKRLIGLVKARTGSNPRIDLGDYRTTIDNALNQLLFQVRGLMPSFGMAPFAPYLTGGAVSVLPVGVMPSARPSVDRLPNFSKQLRTLYNGFVNRLENMNKTLSKNTKDQVEKVFKQCEEAEERVKGILQYFDSYARLAELNGDRARVTYNKEQLEQSYDKLQKAVGKGRRRYYSILDIAGVTGTAAMDAEGSNMEM